MRVTRIGLTDAIALYLWGIATGVINTTLHIRTEFYVVLIAIELLVTALAVSAIMSARSTEEQEP